MGMLRITYRHSTIGHMQRHKDTVRSLGLRRLNQSVLLPDRPDIRGMVRHVANHVSVEEVPDGEAAGHEEGSR